MRGRCFILRARASPEGCKLGDMIHLDLHPETNTVAPSWGRYKRGGTGKQNDQQRACSPSLDEICER